MGIADKKISEFIAEVVSNSPTPGGGAVAALVAALSASLIEMVTGLTIGKKGYEKVNLEMKKVKQDALGSRKKLLQLADEDCQAFEEVMREYKLKPRSEEQIQKALKEATRVPLEIFKEAGKLERLSLRLSKVGNKNAFSDAKSAYYLARAAKLSAEENVKINLKSISDDSWKAKIIADLKASW